MNAENSIIFKRFKIVSTDLAVVYFILWPRVNDYAEDLVIDLEKEVDGCKLMITTKLFGSLLDLFH